MPSPTPAAPGRGAEEAAVNEQPPVKGGGGKWGAAGKGALDTSGCPVILPRESGAQSPQATPVGNGGTNWDPPTYVDPGGESARASKLTHMAIALLFLREPVS